MMCMMAMKNEILIIMALLQVQNISIYFNLVYTHFIDEFYTVDDFRYLCALGAVQSRKHVVYNPAYYIEKYLSKSENFKVSHFKTTVNRTMVGWNDLMLKILLKNY